MLRTILLEPIFNILLFLYAIIPGGDFGLAIIVLTILIRLALWPLMKKQLLSQKAMNDLKPEIAKLKKKAKGDKQKESQLMVELFKEKKVNPFSSIGIMLLQLPILLTLFFVLREVVVAENIGKSAYGFVQRLPEIQAITTNPNLFDPTLLGYFHMADTSIILAAVAGLMQFIQAKQMTPQNTMDSDKASKVGSNMVMILPVVTVAIAATLPSALAVYWAVSSAVAVFQQHIVLKADVDIMRRFRSDKKTDGKKVKKAKIVKDTKDSKNTKKEAV